ncbi:permease [Sulfolobales archaeon HS-7]|nr:permease [Sulfolobales archaeon HS-7]
MFNSYAIITIFVISTALLITRKVRYDIIGALVFIALLLVGAVPIKIGLEDLSSPAVIVLISVLLLSKSIESSGFLENFGEFLSVKLRRSTAVTFTLLLLVGFASGFVSDVALTAIMIPVFSYVSEKFNESKSKYLIPLSYAAILGGRYTIIGTTPNIVIDQLWYEKTGNFLPFFQFLKVGLIMMSFGFIGLFVISKLLPSISKPLNSIEDFKTKNYVVEAKLEDGELIGKPISYLEGIGVKVLDVFPRRMSFGQRVLMKGDTILMEISPDKLPNITSIDGLKLAPSSSTVEGGDVRELLVTSSSLAVGKTIADIEPDFVYSVKVLGISGRLIQGNVSKINIAPGDILLVQGKDENITKMMNSLGLVPLYERKIKVFNPKKGIVAIASLTTAVILSSLGVNTAESFLIGILPTAIIEYKNIYRYIDWPLVIFVATYIPMGYALQSTGFLLKIPYLNNLLVLFLFTVLIANLVNNISASVIMGPVALTLPHPLLSLTVVAMGSSSTFLTPFSHQANLLVNDAGGYSVKHYLISGTIILSLVFIGLLIFLFVH